VLEEPRVTVTAQPGESLPTETVRGESETRPGRTLRLRARR